MELEIKFKITVPDDAVPDIEDILRSIVDFPIQDLIIRRIIPIQYEYPSTTTTWSSTVNHVINYGNYTR